MEAKPCVHVVDDEPEVREALSITIEMMDLAFAGYESGSEFLERYDTSQPGCLIVDLRMPGMSGLELLDILHERRVLLPAIMITGHGDIQAAVHAMRAGAVDFLEKPYRLDVLRACIQKALQQEETLRRKSMRLDAIRTHYDSLSDEEREVMRLTLAGAVDKAIAAKMNLSIRTVQLRRARLMKIMMAGSRAELIEMAQLLADSGGDKAD